MYESNESFQETQEPTNENNDSQPINKKHDWSLVVISGLTLVFLFLGVYKFLFTKPPSTIETPTTTEVEQIELISSEEVEVLRLELELDEESENIIISNNVKEPGDSEEYSVSPQTLEPNLVPASQETKEPTLVEVEAEVNINPESSITLNKIYADESNAVMEQPVVFKGIVFSKDIEAGEFVILNNGNPTTVFVTADTRFKIYDKDFSLSDLKSTDIVEIQGMSNIHGTDLMAATVTVIGVQKTFITND